MSSDERARQQQQQQQAPRMGHKGGIEINSGTHGSRVDSVLVIMRPVPVGALAAAVPWVRRQPGTGAEAS